MLQLYTLTLACLVGFAQNAELFSDKCCAKKNVGGVDYSQIPGDTTGFDNCKADCVYERDDEPGSRFCFSTGDEPVMCTESTSTAQEVSVTRENGQLSFKSSDISLSCNIGSLPSASEDEFKEINCTGSELQTSETEESATLISSFSSNGSLEWISFHSKDEWIHCIYIRSVKFCWILPPGAKKNKLYVEGAFPINNQDANLHVQLAECNTSCETNSSCSFWTFSYLQDTGHHSRNHDDKSECGLRSYDACCLIPTNRDQWYGFVKTLSGQPPAPTPDPNPKNNVVAVWNSTKNLSNKECYELCRATPDCTTWTWDKTQCTCSLNNYIPTRLINIGYVNNPTPNLFSGCFSRGFNCDTVPTSGSD